MRTTNETSANKSLQRHPFWYRETDTMSEWAMERI